MIERGGSRVEEEESKESDLLPEKIISLSQTINDWPRGRGDKQTRSRYSHFISFPHASGQVLGIGRARVLTATPYATDSESNPLYGVSPVSNSHSSTP